MTRPRMVVTCTILCVVAAACARSLDAVVANPCDVPAEIRFSGSGRPPWFHRTVVPPATATVVNGVFADVGGDMVGYIEVSVRESEPQVLPVPRGTEEELVAVVIPATAC